MREMRRPASAAAPPQRPCQAALGDQLAILRASSDFANASAGRGWPRSSNTLPLPCGIGLLRTQTSFEGCGSCLNRPRAIEKGVEGFIGT
jgi:hypothetical protein